MIKRLLSKALFSSIKSIQWLMQKVFGVNKKKVVFISFGGKSYSDNPRAISEKLHEVDSDYEIVWLFNSPDNKKSIIPSYIRCVKNNSLSSLYELATAGFWIDNFAKSTFTYKSSKQCYIQTWHGDRAIKKILYDSPFSTSKNYLVENRICNIIVTGSKFAENMYKTAMDYPDRFLKVGCPRNDVLFAPSIGNLKNARDNLSIKSNKHVMLYAPTLRRAANANREKQKIQDIDLLSIISELEQKTESEWICLIRSHSGVNGLEGFPKSEKIIDCSDYEDMADILCITDVLITDYSSSATDFILTEKPVFLYQSDIQEYLTNDRTFYYDIQDTGFLVSYSMEELISQIRTLDWDDYSNEKIREYYGTYETGNAAFKTVQLITEYFN